MSEDPAVKLYVPGRRTRRAAKIVLVSGLILLTVLGSIGNWLPGIASAFESMFSSFISPSQGTCLPLLSNSTGTPTNQCSLSPGVPGSSIPQLARADRLPDLSLPKTVVSSVDSFIGAGGVIHTAPDNLTLFNSQVAYRLLGGLNPHDQLLGPDHNVLSDWAFWGVEANIGGQWISLTPSLNSFTVIGTNKTGTFVARSMNVGAGPYSGTFTIIYGALSTGRLKWDLDFAPGSNGHYRFGYSWSNITSASRLNVLSKQFQAVYLSANYTLSWNDVQSLYNASAAVQPDIFSLAIDLGTISAGHTVTVDPYTVSTNVDQGATAFTFQRKIFYDPVGGYYWAFYYDGYQELYRNSKDGVSWSGSNPLPGNLGTWQGPAEVSLPSVTNLGQTVAVAKGQIRTDTATAPYSDRLGVEYAIGNITGSTISWSQDQYINGNSGDCETPFPSPPNSGTSCTMTVETRFVSAAFDIRGGLHFGYNLVYQATSGWSPCGAPAATAESDVIMDGSPIYCGNPGYTSNMRPVVLPSNNPYGFGAVFQYYDQYHYGSTVQLAYWFITTCCGPDVIEQIDSGLLDSPEISAISDTNYGTHVVYKMANGNVNYAFRAASNSSSAPVTVTPNIFSASAASPTLTLDASTNDVYALAIQGSSLMMRRKPLAQSWFDNSIAYVVTNRNNPANLGSNYVSVSGSATNSGQVLLFWTEGTSSYNAEFASIPIATVWSPYSRPSDPWDTNGVIPFGQYFANLGEYVSPSTGMLTIRQTDLSVPGRGLNLEITRVYTEPYSFLSNGPYNFEIYPWAPMGDGWQLNFPWLNNTGHPLYVHLWDGQGFRIPSSFWTGSTSTFENHQGEIFRLVRNADGSINFYDKSGASYTFGTSPNHALVSITDSTGNNTITLTYGSNSLISCITDTVGRAFTLSYSGTPSLLQNITQVSGTCTSQGSTVRTVGYSNNGQSLTSETDPIGRKTYYSYNATGSSTVAPWLLSRISYPTHWLTNYTYSGALLGTQANTYRVKLQITGPSATIPTRQFTYVYTQGAGDQITGSTVTSYNGTQTSSSTEYAFSFIADVNNVTDASGNLLSGNEQFFGVNGQIPKEVVFVSDGHGNIGSYTNYFRYDLWGNLIYSRKVINPSSNWYHETFNNYYNNGLPSGFYYFAETLSQANHTRTNNNWNITSGHWMVANGEYLLTGERGNQSLIEVPEGDAAVQITVRWLAGQYFEGYVGFRYQTSGNHYEVYLSAYDNTLRFVKVTGGTYTRLQAATVTPSKNVHYVIRVESSGYTHTVYLNGTLEFRVTDQDSSMLTGRYIALGTYSSTSPSNPEQIGFSNIYVQPLSSAFSSSFFSTGPNSNIHDRLSGTAELQNGVPTPPEETYYGYTAWGGLSQTKTRYDPDPLAVDSWAIGQCSHSTTSCSVTLTTSHTNDIVMVYATESLDLLTSCTFSVSDAQGLSWATRSNVVYARSNGSGGYRDQLQEFYAKSANLLSSDTITESISGCTSSYGGEYNGLLAFAISGANFNAPFDPASGVPGTNHDEMNSAFANATMTTSTSGDLVFAGLQHGGSGVPTTQSGFTSAISTSGYGLEFTITGGALTSFIAEYGFSPCSICPWEMIADAVQPSGGVATQWLTTTRTYDFYGNPKTLTDARGNVTSYGYSSKYQSAYLTSLNQTLAPGGTLISNRYGYNLIMGTMTSIVDPNGYNTTYQYDILSRTSRITYPNISDFMSHSYNDAANYVNITNENGWKTRQNYDGLGRLSSVQRFLSNAPTSPVYSTESYTRDWQDKIINHIDPLGNIYNYTYDALSRLTQTKRPDGNTTRVSYNDIQSWVVTTDEYGHSRCRTYDRLGRLLSVVEYSDPNCNPLSLAGSIYVTNYYHTELGDLVKVTNANQVSSLYQYDNLGHLTQTTYADGTSESYVYDSNGNLVKKVDRAGVSTLSSYDSLNRISTTTFCGTTITGTSYVYDKNSNPLQILNQNATVSYIYDSRNRVLNETHAVNPAARTVVDLGCSGSGGSITRTGGVAKTYMVGTTYNGELVNTIAYPTIYTSNPDITIKYSYDGLGRILNVLNVSTSVYFAQLTYSKADQVVGVQYGNGLVGNYTYDKLSRANTITLKNPSTNSVMMSLTYSYNNTGTVSSLVGQVNSATVNGQYKYDPLERLVNSTVTNGGGRTTFWYQYDNIGNMMAQSLNGTITNYTYNKSNNELVSSSSPGTSTAYAYDQDGRLLNKNVTTTGTVRWYYTWDQASDLLKVTNSTGQALYAYDGGGRRVEAVESGAVWYFAYTGTEVLYKNRLNTYNSAYIFASGLRIANFADSSTYYYHADALGSIRMITYPNAAVAYTNGYQPYGQYTGTLTGNLGKWAIDKFDGKPFSTTTGLYYYYHRWYDSSTGRFISADPAPGQLSNPQTLNLYVYAVDRPTSVVDPTGLDSCNLWDWNTWGGCANNAAQTLNNVVVQPAANFVNNHIVKPIVNNVVKPLVNNVVVPLVNNVVVPYLKDYYNGLVASYNTLSNVGSQMWNGYQSFTKTVHDEQQSFYRSVNQDLQGFAHDITHLHISNMNQFFTGLAYCGALIGLAAVAYFALPEIAAGEAGALMAEGAAAAAGAAGASSLEYDKGMAELIAFGAGLAIGCGGNIAASLSTS